MQSDFQPRGKAGRQAPHVATHADGGLVSRGGGGACSMSPPSS